jgi:predicted RNA binding protein YcfA (HicA-like mRNA interferase family)
MAQRDKLLEAICRNPRNVRFADACRAATAIGFEPGRIRGSHHTFKRPGEMTILNFQKMASGKIPAYQAEQLIEMIRKHTEPP